MIAYVRSWFFGALLTLSMGLQMTAVAAKEAYRQLREGAGE
jgi:hypothetical protein